MLYTTPHCLVWQMFPFPNQLAAQHINAKGSDSIMRDDLAQPYSIMGKTTKGAILLNLVLPLVMHK